VTGPEALEGRPGGEPRVTCFLYLTTDKGGVITVELPDGLLVWRPSRKKSERNVPSPAVSIVARDFMRRSDCALGVPMAKKEYYFEK